MPDHDPNKLWEIQLQETARYSARAYAEIIQELLKSKHLESAGLAITDNAGNDGRLELNDGGELVAFVNKSRFLVTDKPYDRFKLKPEALAALTARASKKDLDAAAQHAFDSLRRQMAPPVVRPELLKRPEKNILNPLRFSRGERGPEMIDLADEPEGTIDDLALKAGKMPTREAKEIKNFKDLLYQTFWHAGDDDFKWPYGENGFVLKGAPVATLMNAAKEAGYEIKRTRANFKILPNEPYVSGNAIRSVLQAVCVNSGYSGHWERVDKAPGSGWVMIFSASQGLTVLNARGFSALS